MHHPLKHLVSSRKLAGIPSSVHQLRTMSDTALTVCGLTRAEILRVRAAFRLAGDSIGETERITRSTELAKFLARELPILLHAQQEYFCVLALNTSATPIGAPIISTIGTLRNAHVHPRETFREAIARSANSIATCHNHPSGDLVPSDGDYEVFSRLDQAGEILGIPVIDHLIISRRGWYSHRECERHFFTENWT